MKAGWILTLCLALPFAAGCPTDDVETGEGIDDDAGSDTSGVTASTTAPTTMSSTTQVATSTDTDPSAGPSESGPGNDDASDLVGCAADIEEDTTDGSTENLQVTWGAPCTEDAECIELLGEGGVCLLEAVLYELPLGYCSKTCTLEGGTMYSIDDPQCDPNGGVDCIGQAPLFMVCAPQCTDDAQCFRSGYTCRNFPLIANEGDPTYCLMPDCCEGTCAEE